jgi:hypothetical protein
MDCAAAAAAATDQKMAEEWARHPGGREEGRARRWATEAPAAAEQIRQHGKREEGRGEGVTLDLVLLKHESQQRSRVAT